MEESMKRSNSKAAQEAQAKYCYLINIYYYARAMLVYTFVYPPIR